jgi:hypothetical protein
MQAAKADDGRRDETDTTTPAAPPERTHEAGACQ